MATRKDYRVSLRCQTIAYGELAECYRLVRKSPTAIRETCYRICASAAERARAARLAGNAEAAFRAAEQAMRAVRVASR